MALLSVMGPPPSPRETRRSGRRSAPAASTSTSKSPDSDQPPKQKDTSTRPALNSNASGSRNKRLKQEDLEDGDEERRNNPAPSVASNGSTQGASNGKSKRKAKDKDKQVEEQVEEETAEPFTEDGELAAGDEEEQGITRCVCGSTGMPLPLPSSPSDYDRSVEDDPDAGEFMIQCEGCKVWQHGPCMGFMTEDQVDDDDYYCEQCKPELHVDLLKRLSSKSRRSHNANASRVSRSRSPSQHKQQSKRRNTMNSRDFDESLKEVMEATAAEAAGKDPSVHGKDEPPKPNDGDHDVEGPAVGKKKRKRTEDELPSKKRTRSASTTSDRQGSAVPRDDTPVSASMKPVSQAPAIGKSGAARQKRGSRKNVPEPANPVDGEEGASSTPGPSTNKRPGNGNRKAAGVKRPPLIHAVSSTGVNQDNSASRARNPTGINQHSAANAEARAYRNSHAYAVSQQPLLTSWGLPDYLAHLEHMLPTDIPQPLEVRSASNNSAPRGDSIDRTIERGVKVKWPSKRMSVGDMNKRVRALVEWVGREQANALERERRREALEKEIHDAPPTAGDPDDDVVMTVDDPSSNSISAPRPTENGAAATLAFPPAFTKESTSATMREMEELMEELIGFQERFGPGAKTRERERRQGASS